MTRANGHGRGRTAFAAYFLGTLFALGIPLHAQESRNDTIAITTEQAGSLGIKTGPLVSAVQGAGAGFPAKAVIPNSQLRVIGAPLDGLIESILVAVGDPVKKGQTVATLISPSLIDKQRQFLHALSAANVARSAMNRDDALLKEGIIARSRYQTTQSANSQAEADLSEKRQSLALSGMQPAEIKALESNNKITSTLTITSPLEGFVLEQMAIAGQRIEAAGALYKIGSLTPMWLEINMPAANVARVKEGDAVNVRNVGASGRVLSIGKSVDSANQTIMVRAEITENAQALRPQQLVIAAIDIGSGGASQWQVPPAAVARQDGNPYVFVKIPSGFRAQPVVVENENASVTTISGSLSATDEVVVSGVLAVKGRWQGLGGGN